MRWLIMIAQNDFYYLQPYNADDEQMKKIRQWQNKYNIDEEDLLQYTGRSDVLLVEGLSVQSETSNNYYFEDLSNTVMNSNCPLVIDHNESLNSTIGKVLSILQHKDNVEQLQVVFGQDNIKNIKDYNLWSRWSIQWRIQKDSKETAYCTECGKEAESFFGWLYCPDHMDARIRVAGDIEISHISFVTREGSPGSGIKAYLNENVNKSGEKLTDDEKRTLYNLIDKVNYSDSIVFKGDLSSKNKYKQGGVDMELSEVRNAIKQDMEALMLSAKKERDFEEGIKERDRRIENMKQDIEKLSKQYEESQKLIEELTNQKKELDAKLSEKEQYVSEKEKELAEATNKLEQIEKEQAEKLQKEKDEVIKSILSFKEKLEGKLSDEDMEDEVKFLGSLTIDKLRDRNERLQKAVTELSNEDNNTKPAFFKDGSASKNDKDLSYNDDRISILL